MQLETRVMVPTSLDPSSVCGVEHESPTSFRYTVQKPVDGWYAMGFPNGTLRGMPRMLEDDLADLTTGPQPPNPVYFAKLHFSPIVVESMLTMLSGMRTAFVSQAQSFSGSFDSYVSRMFRENF